jgi:hypothetical protein
MKAIFGLLSIVVALGIGMGIYYEYLKQATPTTPGSVATQAISTTGVQMDLNSIAQAERMYVAQNGSYGTMDQLTSSGTLAFARNGRDGYTYTLDASSGGFTLTAKWSPQTPEQQSLRYPTFTVDQTYQIHEEQ